MMGGRGANSMVSGGRAKVSVDTDRAVLSERDNGTMEFAEPIKFTESVEFTRDFIAEFEALGAKVWAKGDKFRLYLGKYFERVGKVEYDSRGWQQYGNYRIDGSDVSNKLGSRAREEANAYYIDIMSGRLVRTGTPVYPDSHVEWVRGQMKQNFEKDLRRILKGAK